MGITLPFEDGLNPYVSEELAFEFHYFFTRKFWMVYHCQVSLGPLPHPCLPPLLLSCFRLGQRWVVRGAVLIEYVSLPFPGHHLYAPRPLPPALRPSFRLLWSPPVVWALLMSYLRS
jgi:hypothetical protein